MTSTFVTVTLTPIDCWSCHAIYGLDESARQRFQTTGGSWYCPYCGKSSVYCETENQRLARELAATKRAQEFWIQRQQETAREKVELRHQLRAQKAVTTRIRNRTHHGVCPVSGCRRTFTNLARHMKTKHPTVRATP